MKKLSLAYFGSPDFAADFLEKILLDKNLPVEVKLVVTQPDSPAGRKQILTPTPVKQIANKYKSEIRNPKSEKNSNFKNSKIVSNFELRTSDLKDIDIALVYAYGDLIPKELLTLPKYGFWNIHPSLLPKYRGTSPIATPLINGDKITGVTIIKMDEEIDHGPIIAQESLTITQDDKRPDLEKKLTDLAFEMFKKTIIQLTGSRVNGFKTKEQSHKEATYTKKLSKQEGLIEFRNLKLEISNSSEILYNRFRGLYPWPGIWTILPNGKRLKITELNIVRNKNLGSLQIKRVQLEGKNEVDFETFNKAYKIF